MPVISGDSDWNGFIPLFISAIDDEELWEDFRDQEERGKFVESLDVYERSLLDRMGALPEFLKRRGYYLKSKSRNDMGVLKQEYPVTPAEAVRASGRSRFSLDKLDVMPIEKGALVSLCYSQRWDRKILKTRDSGSLLTVYRDPQQGHRYVLAIDTAEGKLDEHGRDPDNSVMHVCDCDAGMEQVAKLGHPVPESYLSRELKRGSPETISA